MAHSFVNSSAVSVGTTSTQVVAGAAGVQTAVHALYVANVTAGTIKATVEVYDASATATIRLANEHSLAAGETLMLDKPVNLEADDLLKVKSDTAASIDAFASILKVV